MLILLTSNVTKCENTKCCFPHLDLSYEDKIENSQTKLCYKIENALLYYEYNKLIIIL